MNLLAILLLTLPGLLIAPQTPEPEPLKNRTVKIYRIDELGRPILAPTPVDAKAL